MMSRNKYIWVGCRSKWTLTRWVNTFHWCPVFLHGHSIGPWMTEFLEEEARGDQHLLLEARRRRNWGESQDPFYSLLPQLHPQLTSFLTCVCNRKDWWRKQGISLRFEGYSLFLYSGYLKSITFLHYLHKVLGSFRLSLEWKWGRGDPELDLILLSHWVRAMAAGVHH